MEYQKINTLFKRDSKNIIIPSQLTLPEFEYLKDLPWECTEKIDGTNIRIELEVSQEGDFTVAYKGRTDKANIPNHLLTKLNDIFSDAKWSDIFPQACLTTVTLYGEGYGMKIQNGGNYIKNDVDFILFDVRIGNWWLNRESITDIADKLNIKVVPIIGYMTIPEAIEYVKRGFKSTIAENKEYYAEGLVLKTPCGLRFRNGERIITKIKTCDFEKYAAVHKEEIC